MNKKITLYELMGLVKDGQAPKKIEVSRETFIFSNGRYYEENHIGDDNCRMGDYFALDGMLNDEVEILEEEKKIEKLDNFTTSVGRVDDSNVEKYIQKLFKQQYEMFNKINEITDEINKINTYLLK